MLGYKTPADILTDEALTMFRAGLEEDIQCPEALELEATYRLTNLVQLLESGEWESDAQGNVFPATTSREDRYVIARNCRFTILDKLPNVIGGTGWGITWSAIGSLLCNVMVVGYHDSVNRTVRWRNSEVVDTRINL